MNRFNAILQVVTVLVLGGCAALTDIHQYTFGHSDVTVTALRCEYRVNPLGLDLTEPRLSWIIESDQRGQKQNAYQILVASSQENLKKGQGDLWDSGKVDSGQTAQIIYRGKPLRPRVECYWKVRVWDRDDNLSVWSKPAYWTMGLVDPKHREAKWIGYDANVQRGKASKDELVLPAPRYLRNVFWVYRPIRRATVYASSLGLYELHINGKRVGEDYFTPGWTDYSKRVYYQTYDVTDLLRKAKQRHRSVILADGWYAGYMGSAKRESTTAQDPGCSCSSRSNTPTAPDRLPSTDESWKATYGPLLEADFLMGETYDARKEMPGWDSTGFNDSAWERRGRHRDNSEGQLQSYPGVTVQKILEIKPVRNSPSRKKGHMFSIWGRILPAGPG